MIQELEDLFPWASETSLETQVDLSSFWTMKMAMGWPVVKQNFASLEALLMETKNDSYFNSSSVGRKLALLSTPTLGKP